MRIRPGIAFLSVAAVLAGCGGNSFHVTGRWQGTLTQRGLAPFTVSATIRTLGSSPAGAVHYSGIDCGGHWTYLGSDGSVFRFREVIDSGRSSTCKGVGTVMLTPAGADHLRYVFRGGAIVSRGLLARR